MRWKLTPYQKIMRAYKEGRTSLRLTDADLDQLGLDDAIATRATNDDIEQKERSERDGDSHD